MHVYFSDPRSSAFIGGHTCFVFGWLDRRITKKNKEYMAADERG
jgi:hypothetical protein